MRMAASWSGLLQTPEYKSPGRPQHRPGASPRGQNDGPPAVAALLNLQEEYRAWLDNLPPNLESSPLAHKLQAIAELDLEELQAIEPPRGYGRD